MKVNNDQRDYYANLHAEVDVYYFLKFLQQTDFLRGNFLFR